MNKTSLSVIPHVFNEIEIDQRKFDGYVNATAMCKACDKLFADYNRLSITKEFLEALSSDMGIPISQLVMVSCNSHARGNMSGAAVCVAPRKKRRATLAYTALFFPA